MALSFITPLSRLRSDAAASYKRMRKAGLPSGVTRGYASAKEQQRLYDGWIARKPGFNFALPPSKSKHVQGIALDLPGNAYDPRTPRGWMRKYGKSHGWHPVVGEDWHFEYDRNRDQVLSDLIKEAEDRKTAKTRVKTVKKALGMRGWYGPKRNRMVGQQLLQVWGYYDGRIDGIYGPKNKSAWARLKADMK